MKIVMYSSLFDPSLGGMEVVAELLARGLTQLGHAVTVSTDTPGPSRRTFPFAVERQLSSGAQLALHRHADVVVHHCVSLKKLPYFWSCGRPRLFIHHTYYQALDGSRTLPDRLKSWVCSRSENVAVSRAVAATLGAARVDVLPNPYDDTLFRFVPGPRERDLIFVGRLVSDKGVDLLIDALAELKTSGIAPTLTVVGDGPEHEALLSQIQALGLSAQIRMVGAVGREDLPQYLSQHRIMVVPSRWNEPFGIVALEGIACGCRVIGSSGGGLAEAVGPCGKTFPNGDVGALARALAEVLEDRDQSGQRPEQLAHIQQFTVEAISRRYELLFQRLFTPAGAASS